MIKYFHTDLQEEHKTFAIKNKDEKRKYDIDYFSRKQFRDVEKAKGETEPNILGYCKLRRLKKDDAQQDRVFCAAKQEYTVSSKKSIFQRKVGYVRVISETEIKSFSEDGSAVPQTEKEPFTYLIVTRFSFMPLLLLLPLFLLLFLGLLRGCENTAVDSPPQPVIHVPQITEAFTLPIEEDAEDWDGTVPSDDSVAGAAEDIEIVGYERITVTKENPYVQLINPTGNTVYFKYAIMAPDKQKVVMTTNLIPPGKYVQWNAREDLLPGEYDVPLLLSTYDLTTQAPCNGANLHIHITVQ